VKRSQKAEKVRKNQSPDKGVRSFRVVIAFPPAPGKEGLRRNVEKREANVTAQGAARMVLLSRKKAGVAGKGSTRRLCKYSCPQRKGEEIHKAGEGWGNFSKTGEEEVRV